MNWEYTKTVKKLTKTGVDRNQFCLAMFYSILDFFVDIIIVDHLIDLITVFYVLLISIELRFKDESKCMLQNKHVSSIGKHAKTKFLLARKKIINKIKEKHIKYSSPPAENISIITLLIMTKINLLVHLKVDNLRVF